MGGGADGEGMGRMERKGGGGWGGRGTWGKLGGGGGGGIIQFCHS